MESQWGSKEWIEKANGEIKNRNELNGEGEYETKEET